MNKNNFIFSLLLGLIVFNVYSDSFKYNLYNNHGVVGLVKFTSDYADTDLAKLLPTPQVSYQSKLGRTRAS